MTTKPPSPAVVRVILALQMQGKQTERNGENWLCQCPAHEDQHPSFAVSADEKDGKALVVCRAGCSQDEIMKALGIPPKDLFLTKEEQKTYGRGVSIPETHVNRRTVGQKPNGHGDLTNVLETVLQNAPRTVETDTRTPRRDDPAEGIGLMLDQYAAAKKLDKEFLQRLGLSTVYLDNGQKPVVSIPYKNAEGIVKAVQFRQALHKGDHEDGRFFWSRKGTTPLLYGLWRREALTAATDIILAEGASDCHTLWTYGMAALGLPSANGWKEEWASELGPFERIYIVREPDKGGEAVEHWVAESSIRHRVWFIDLGKYNDPSGLHCDSPGLFQEKWAVAVSHATSWADAYQAKLRKEVETIYKDIQPLLYSPDLLHELRTAMGQLGYVGDSWAPMLVYLILTSRLLDRPMNGAVLGPPSVGKNLVVDIAKEFLPDNEVHAFEASSPLALVYDDADFQHKAVVVGELDSLPDEGPAGSAIRSLAQNNCTVYEVVEKDQKTGKFRTRRIIREGPTVLLTTGIKSPAPQLQTRMLEIHLQDDPKLTHEILERQAEERLEDAPAKPDLTQWKHLQQWLALQTSKVRIPYAKALAKALRDRVKHPPTRLRRDHPKLLTCIEAVTLLYQCQRSRTRRGELLATLGDYDAARTLLEPVFGAIATDGVTDAIRQTVAAVKELLEAKAATPQTVSEHEIVQHLQLSKTAVHYRVSRCLAGGWLINHEDRKGRPAQLVLGVDVPEETPILPTVGDIRRYWPDAPPPAPPSPPLPSSPTAPVVEPPVNDVPPTENRSETGQADGEPFCAQIIERLIDQWLNDGVPTEIGDGSTVLMTPPDIPPSPLPPEGAVDPTPMWEDDDVVLQNGRFRQILMQFPATTLDGVRSGASWHPLRDRPVVANQDAREAESKPLSHEPLPSIEVGADGDTPAYTYIREATELQKYLSDIFSAKVVGLDVETTPVNLFTDRICLVQVATPDQTYIIDAWKVPIHTLAPLMTGDRWLIGQNMKFDLSRLAQAGLPWPDAAIRLLDTMLCAQVLDAGKGAALTEKHALEGIAQDYLHEDLDKSLQLSDWSAELSTEQLAYAAKDAQILLRLAPVFKERLQDDQLWSTALLESACVPALAWIELAGMPVATDDWHMLIEQLSQQKHALVQALDVMAGTSINWNSRKQAGPVLEARGIPVKSLAKEALVPYVSDDLVATLLDYKKVEKSITTYGETWLSRVDPQTHRVHGDFLSIGTGVGRMSGAKPNLQNIPRSSTYRRMFRAIEGRVLMKADYSQLHLRIAAVIAPDQTMQNAYAQGKDLHYVTAASLQSIAEEAVSKAQRQHAKPFNFGLLYAMGVDRLQEEAWNTYGVRLNAQEASQYRGQWFKLYPGIKKWHRKEQYAISHDHMTETRSLLGRRRKGMTYLPERLSSRVLGIEADGLKRALVHLFHRRDEVPSARIINVIHDEVLVECEQDHVDRVEAWVTRGMEQGMQDALKGKAVTPVDVQVGHSWAADEEEDKVWQNRK